jgi:hypothetical protein
MTKNKGKSKHLSPKTGLMKNVAAKKKEGSRISNRYQRTFDQFEDQDEEKE